jgi:hypothetical protein
MAATPLMPRTKTPAGAAAVGQSNDGTVTRGSKTDPHGPASLLR